MPVGAAPLSFPPGSPGSREDRRVNRLPPLDPAVAETRLAVRRALAEASAAGARRGGSQLVLVALSGGADSLALAAATAFEAPRRGLRAGAVIVDHGLQPDSALVAARAQAQATGLGLDPVIVRRVTVETGRGDGPEAAARTARYRAFESVRVETGAAAILTAHTRDDQSEQVLLALARGSGIRAISGISPRREGILRPFLGVARRTTERACAAQGLEAWADPHNSDPAYTRVRVRTRILPALVRELGPGIAANLARTAELAREDADALDALAAERLDALLAERDDTAPGADPAAELPVAGLAELPAALRNRIIRSFANRSFGTSLSREHTLAVAALVTAWEGQAGIDVPGGSVRRSGDRLLFSPR